jgi:3-hydroxypropanoate dehydrogenase
MSETLSKESLDVIFGQARTFSAWLPKPVDDALLRQIYEIARLGPTSANTSPMRVVFCKSKEAKERLKPALMQGNVDKTMASPVCAIIADDQKFYEFVPKLWPHNPQFGDMFKGAGKEEMTKIHAFRNSSLGGAYFIIAARALGLDVGPMSGFDNAKVDAEFFPDGRHKSNFLINMGYGDASTLKPRLPRLDFEEACRIL